MGDSSTNVLAVAMSIANVLDKDIEEVLTDQQIVAFESVTDEWRAGLEPMQGAADGEDAEDKLKSPLPGDEPALR